MKSKIYIPAILLVLFFFLFGQLVNAQWVHTFATGWSGQTHALALRGTHIFGGDTYGGGAYESTNNGTTWVTKNTGLSYTNVESLLVNDTTIFAATNGGVFRSTINATSWTQLTNGLFVGPFITVGSLGSIIFAGAFNGSVFKSTDNGNTWINVTGPLQTSANSTKCFEALGSKIFAGTYNGGVFLSTDTGNTWTAVNSGLTNLAVYCLEAMDSTLFAGTDGGGVFKSTDNGTTWSAVNTGLTAIGVRALKSVRTNLLAGTSGGGVFESSNKGGNWTTLNNGMTATSIISLGENGSRLFAGAGSTGGMFYYPCSSTSTIYQTGCNSYTSPSGNHTWTTSGIYTDTIGNMHGCDSIITINLTIKNNTSSSQTITACGSYTSPSGNYTWTTSGVHNDTIPNAAGCDSIITINLWINPLPVSFYTLYPDTTIAHNWFAINQCTGTPPLTYVWNWGDSSAVSTGATPSHTYADSGYYNICVTVTDVNGCVNAYCDSSTFLNKGNSNIPVTINVIASGIKDIDGNSAINISPNPVDDVLNVSLSKPLDANSIITISDIQGRVVKEEKISQNNLQAMRINVSALSRGVYLLRMDEVVKRFVKM
ncbi:MAG: T9SS type A sorting domain-containing protein [Bacteroidia bacterium]